MDSIGRILKDKRNALNQSLDEICQETKIRETHLSALEADNFTFLPEFYVKSYLKIYSKHLGLAAEDMLQKYRTSSKVAEPVTVVEVRPKQQALVKAQTAVEVRPQIKTVASPALDKVLEWALGLGTFLLLISLGFAYFQYRAQVYARPLAHIPATQTEKITDVADIAVVRPQAFNGSSLPMELQVTPNKKIWLQVKADNNQAAEYTLAPQQNLVWLAKAKIDLQIKQAVKTQKPEQQFSEDEIVRLSFAVADVK